MARLTSDWTERHVEVAAAVLVAALAGGLALQAEPPYSVVAWVAMTLTVLAALSLDAFGGIISGFTASAGVIAARQLGGDWTPEHFVPSLALTAALVVLGWVTGLASAELRQGKDDTGLAPVVAPAQGSLGLLTPDLALARLDEEIARARRHSRPLTVFLVATDVVDEELSGRARSGALRTVARLVESLVPDTAVPFAVAPDEVAAILPETDEARAWELLGPVVDAAGRASFAVREEAERRSLVDCAELHAVLVPLSAAHPDADALLAELRRRVEAERRTSRPPALPSSPEQVA